MTIKPTRIGLLGSAALIASMLLGSAPALADDGKAALHLMPEDTAMVLSANFSRLKKSPLARKLFDYAVQHSDAAEAVNELREMAGLNIERDIRTMSMGMPGDFERSERLWVLIQGRFNKAKIIALARKKSSSFKRLKHRGVGYMKVDGDTEMAFLGRYLVLTTKDTMPAVIDAYRRKTRTAAQNTVLMALINRGNTSKALWGAFLIPADMRDDIARETKGHSINTVMATLDIRDSLGVTLHMDTSSNTAASAIATMIRAGRDQIAKQPEMETVGLGSAVKSMIIQAKDSSLALSLEVSAADMEKLGQLAATL